ncbi:MAG: hypothetical protein DMG79_12040, partial [Acidobacteria bacterium]
MALLPDAGTRPVSLTAPYANVSFGSTRDFSRKIALTGEGKPSQSEDRCVDIQRRDFLLRFCQGAGAVLIPKSLWESVFPDSKSPAQRESAAGFHLQPHYRSERPLDATLLKVDARLDTFLTEKYADQIAAILARWSAGLLQSPRQTPEIANALATDFLGTSPEPADSNLLRSNASIQVRQNKFSNHITLNRDAFIRELQSTLSSFSKVLIAEFQITRINAEASSSAELPGPLQTRIRYEVVGTGGGFHREQR